MMNPLFLALILCFFSFGLSADQLTIKHENMMPKTLDAKVSYLGYSPNGGALLLSSFVRKEAFVVASDGSLKALALTPAVDEQRMAYTDEALYFLAGSQLYKLLDNGELLSINQAEPALGYDLDVSRSGHYVLSGNYELLRINSLDAAARMLNVSGVHPSDDFTMGYEVLSMQRELSTWLSDKTLLRAWKLADAQTINDIEVRGKVRTHIILNEAESIIAYIVGDTVRFWNYKTNTLLKQQLEFGNDISLGKWNNKVWLLSGKTLYRLVWDGNSATAQEVYQSNADEVIDPLSRHNFSSDGKYAVLTERKGEAFDTALYQQDRDRQFVKLSELTFGPGRLSLHPTKRELAYFSYDDNTLRIYSF